MLNFALKSKDLKKKVDLCTEYLELNPHDIYVWEFKGKLLSLLGREKDSGACAGKAYEEACFELGDDLGLFYGMGRMHSGDNDAAAVGAFQKLLKREPSYIPALLREGDALIGLEKYAEALQCFDSVFELRPARLPESIAWNGRGMALAGMGKNEEAIKCCDRSLSIDLGSPKTWDLRARCLYTLGKYEEAMLSCDKALEIDANDDLARKIKKVASEA